jgi:hypothetical protein
LYSSGRGTLEVSAVGFEDLENTTTVNAASLTIHYVNEISDAAGGYLLEAVDDSQATFTVSSAGGYEVGRYIQVGREICLVAALELSNDRLTVERAAFGTTAGTHSAGGQVMILQPRSVVMPFPRNFFGSPASGTYCFPIVFPNVRVGAAEMYVSNAVGDSEIRQIACTSTLDAGIRTLSGGQICIQVSGYLAIQKDAVPPVVIDGARSIRDVFATVVEAPTGNDVVLRLRIDDKELCRLTIAAGDLVSSVVNGMTLGYLPANGLLKLDIVEVGQTADTLPGRDLTVTVRL